MTQLRHDRTQVGQGEPAAPADVDAPQEGDLGGQESCSGGSVSGRP